MKLFFYKSNSFDLLFDVALLALLGEGGGLFLPDTGSLGLVEHKRGRTLVGVGESMYTVVVSNKETSIIPLFSDHHCIILLIHWPA